MTPPLEARPARGTATIPAGRKIAWGHVALFTLLAFALSWSWDGIWILPKLGELLGAPVTPADPNAVFGNPLNHLPAMFGPMLAALAMRLLVSREGVRGSLGLRRPLRHYAVALLGPVAFLAAIAAALVLSGLARFSLPPDPLTLMIVPLFALLLVLEIVLGFGEEYGWRGYLLPRLMPLGEIPATLVLGVIWSLWHLPVVLAGVILGGHSLWLVVPIHLGFVIVGSFPYAWLGKWTRHNPAVAAVLHGSLNWGQQRLLTFFVMGNALAGLAVIGAGWLVLAMAVYGFSWFRARSRVATQPAG